MPRFFTLSLLGTFIFLIFNSSCVFAKDKVLILHSYHAGYDWVDTMNEEFEAEFNAAEIELEYFYMDTKRKSSAEWKETSAEKAKQKIADMKPDVVIAIDDNAQKLVVMDYVGKPSPKFVFTGVNGDPEAYGFPASNVTGVLERTYAVQTADLLKRIIPSIKKIAYIADDSSTTNLITPRIQALEKAGELGVEISNWERPSTMEEWQAAVKKFNDDESIEAYMIPLYHTVKSQSGDESLLPSDVMKWTVENTRKPIVGLWPFSPKDGALCAVVVNPREHGKEAALMAKELLSGKDASEIPMMVNKDGYVIINMITAEKLGLTIPFDIIESTDEIIE